MTPTPVDLDVDLLRRYGQEGPRYTSYPTALQFHEWIRTSDYEEASLRSAQESADEPLSAYLHIPFCFSPCLYCACNKIVTRDMQRIGTYVERLRQEIQMRSAFFGRQRHVDQLHLGGGTPSYLPTTSLIGLMESLHSHFGLSSEATRDFSIEIDPRWIEASKLRLLKDLGFNRLSFGVQDFDPHVQRAINRLQPPELVERVYREARAVGFESINLDLIYGLPRQTRKSFAETIARVLTLRPERLAVYGYAHMPSAFKAQRRISSSELPDPALRITLLELAVRELTAAGYHYIGMDHFALESDGLARARHDGSLHRSFQGYTTHAKRDLVAFGVSAIGHVANLYVQNHKSIVDYNAALDRGELPTQRGVLQSSEDQLRAAIIQQLMCAGAIDCRLIEIRFGVDFDRHFAKERRALGPLAEDGLVNLRTDRIELTDRGRYLVRSVAMLFDEYLPARSERTALSRVI